HPLSHSTLPMKKRIVHHFESPWQHRAFGAFLVLHMQPDAKDSLSLRGVVLIARGSFVGGSEFD
ncbi:hypothetical protein, partial [Glutamicibacter bergerei]|uniref:hypothetical protein n=1 Tax=Glutamicibacter bergerei TaxID=256702 RepID=UPI0031F9F482